ncbi:MAG: hypothetical protein VW930_06175 [Burkholderiaceae bacterium]
MNNGENPFEIAIFEIMKEAIKAASYEMMEETRDNIEDQMEVELDKLIAEVTEPKDPLTDRLQEIVNDYAEYALFAEALLDIGMFVTPDDVVHLMKFPNKYKREYLIWNELKKPTVLDEMFLTFNQQVWNKKLEDEDGKQTKDTGDQV